MSTRVARRRKVRRCVICREPGHTQAAHTPMERQVYRLTGTVQRAATTGVRECRECLQPAYAKHLPDCPKVQ